MLFVCFLGSLRKEKWKTLNNTIRLSVRIPIPARENVRKGVGSGEQPPLNFKYSTNEVQ